MPFNKRTYSPGQLQFITTSVYRRAPLFLSERFCRCFVQRIEEVRQELKFLLLGWREIADLTNQRSAPASLCVFPFSHHVRKVFS